MTLIQTGKIKRRIPIVLMGKGYWDKVINWEAMVEYGMIAQADADAVFKTDSVEEAYQHLTAKITEMEDAVKTEWVHQ